MNEKLEKLVKLLEDEATAKKLVALSAEDAQKELAKLGIDITADELKVFAKGVQEYDNEGAELDEAALSSVAGGASGYYNDCYRYGKAAGKALAGVFMAGLAVATGW